ncbi:MAG: SH3 domain-containing protein [Caldilineaceae bacterium]|nr:SH3 domain-containing protein [Caldilineaceae bacterium]
MSVESTPIPNTLSQIQRSSAHNDLQPIAADYYNITNANGAPVAGLLVLMDRRQRPVRAELHLHDSTVGANQELAQRQAHLLISDRYSGDRALPLNVLRTQMEEERLSVPLSAPPPPSKIPGWLKPAALTLVALLVFGTAGWFLNDLLGATAHPTVTAPAAVDSVDPPAEMSDAVDDTSASAVAASEGTRIFETNGLPPSRNALPLDLDQRVRVRSGFQVALRTEAGASAGEVLGSMQGGDQATIINGPIWLEGNSDTIVWWFIRLDNGTEAWIAANTSELTLLEPAP